jgi:hypothetical protein
MGYRSDLRVVLYAPEKNFALLKLWMHDEVQKLAAHEFEPPTEITSADVRGYAFKFDDVKWYENYPDVRAFESMIDRFSALCEAAAGTNEPQFACEFVRVGEEAEDIECKSWGTVYGLLSTNTSITEDYTQAETEEEQP